MNDDDSSHEGGDGGENDSGEKNKEKEVVQEERYKTPENYMKKWSDEDRDKLVEMAIAGVSHDELAAHFKRTSRAIASRIAEVAAKEVMEGRISLEDAAKKYFLFGIEITKEIGKREKIAGNKNRANNSSSRRAPEPPKSINENLAEIRGLLRDIVTRLKDIESAIGAQK